MIAISDCSTPTTGTHPHVYYYVDGDLDNYYGIITIAPEYKPHPKPSIRQDVPKPVEGNPNRIIPRVAGDTYQCMPLPDV